MKVHKGPQNLATPLRWIIGTFVGLVNYYPVSSVDVILHNIAYLLSYVGVIKLKRACMVRRDV